MTGQPAVNLRSLVARFHKSHNDHDLDALREVFDEDVECVVDGGALHGVAAVLGYVTAVFREFPRLRIQETRIVAESGDTIVVEHQILNGDPSGGPLRPQGSVCAIYRARGGRIVAHTSYYAAEGADREDVVNVPSRAEGTKMAEEQAALRRVATLVARGVSQDELFAAVNEEVGWLVGADPTSLMRFEADDTVTLLAAWSAGDARLPIGARRPLDDELRSMRDDGRAVRFGPMELPHEAPFVEEARRLAIRSAVGVPIVVDGRVWGGAFAASTRDEPFSHVTETRLAQFTELIATAIANSEARTEVAASRARIVAATDEERRRVVRDLHDGAQQRLVHTIVTLKMARRAMQNDEDDAPALLSEALDNAERATDELRELAHGILPEALTHRGLRAGVDALASRMSLPVENAVSVGRLPAPIAATAYFVVAEALTNVTKHARAERATVRATVEDQTLRIQVRDDGIGGARPEGSGLLGLADRVAALDGELQVESPADGGTLVTAAIPLPG
ncbi:nuclear transport factor 2 family protein [Baekduia sp.]|uniref:nuclear transport factor 2 family protein n=1 Tax=Baekduia sp. TaxID=2600305 RepID=UPI002D1FB1E6|nr:nuclear transport factor 2 family protein [Baekduia sp.]